MRIRILSLACLSLFLVGACTNLDDINTRLDALEGRVSALENQIKALNQNVAATSALMQASTIRSAEEENGVWTITLNNGKVITLVQGKDAEAVIPVMTIDADGYWMIDFGEGPAYVLHNGQKVKAMGTDGITPLFSVNAAGNWTVSYDKGANYSEVLDSAGQPVSALPDGSAPAQDPYFNSVNFESGSLVVVLKDNTTLRIPIVADFYCTIAGSEQLQIFESGQTRQFDVSMSKVTQTFVTAPAGWKASLTDNTLSVTAPVSTRATLASTASDVSILALSAAGAAALAKLQVSLDDEPGPGPGPDPGPDTPIDYYAAWQNGDNIQIAGVPYNKAQYGEGILLTADAPGKDIKGDLHQKSGVFFLDVATESDYFDLASACVIAGDVVLIGRHSDKKAPLRLSASSYFTLGSGKLVMKNLAVDMSVNTKYFCNNNAGATTETFTRWHIEDCRFLHLGVTMLYASSFATGIQSLIVRNCFFDIAGAESLQLFNFSNTTALHLYKELIFSNNEVYASSPLPIQVFQYNQNIAQDASQTWDAVLKAEYNLFYNCPGSNGYFKFYQLKKLSMSWNLFWADSELDSTSYGFILYGSAQDASGVSSANNIAFGLSNNRNWLQAHPTGSVIVPDPNVISKVHENPISAYTPGVNITLLEPYRGYGPQR
ncbi:MAG: hypothetical protein J6X69_02385 [Bacteroidales bacterium]|nr:hypothetical protein [Bacteroidales bacterium]